MPAAVVVATPRGCRRPAGRPFPQSGRSPTRLLPRPSRSRSRSRSRASEKTLAGLGGLERRLGAELGVAIGPAAAVGPADAAGSLRSGSAWSTIKVPIALAVLADAGGPDGLSPNALEDIDLAITASDNEAAARLFAELEAKHGGPIGAARAVEHVLRDAGDSRTRVSTEGRDGFSSYGQTEWTLAAQTRLVGALAAGCLGGRASTRLVLERMGSVTADRWGLGSLDLPARWKGGWGPGLDGRYLARQIGLLEVGGEQVAVAIAALPADGSFGSATAAASELAGWLERRLRHRPIATAGSSPCP